MNDVLHSAVAIRRDTRAWRRALLLAGLGAAAPLWVHLIASWSGADWSGFGVWPRSVEGLIGIVTAPLIHGSWPHVIANAIALFVLGTLAVYAYPRALARALPTIWVLAGLGTWLIGRESAHVGASGITYGLAAFLALLGVLRFEPRAIAVALVVCLLYGGMAYGVLPTDPGVSFEAHLAGALAGLLAAVVWRRADPAAPTPRYSWDLEAEARDAPRSDSDALELDPPREVVPLWSGPTADSGGRVIRFVPRAPDPIAGEPPTPTRH